MRIPEEKRRALYERQVALPATFLEHDARTKRCMTRDKHDLTVKMKYIKE